MFEELHPVLTDVETNVSFLVLTVTLMIVRGFLYSGGTDKKDGLVERDVGDSTD